MNTLSQFTTAHTLAFDQALRDARTQLPRTADQARADRGLCLALNGAVTLYSPTEAHVTSEKDPEVIYHVHSRGGCDCVDGQRRLAAMPDASPGMRACKHHLASILTAMATLNLAVKGYTPEADVVLYPAVAMGESGCTWSGYAMETPDSGWWFDFGDGSGGFYTSVLDLELWNREPVHHITWRETVRSWERWLSAR